MRKRRGNGRFERATVANTFGLKVVACASCRGFNTHVIGTSRPATCKHCGASPLVDITEVDTEQPRPRLRDADGLIDASKMRVQHLPPLDVQREPVAAVSTKREPKPAALHVKLDFGMRDERGRRVGVDVRVYEHEPASKHEPNFYVHVWVTRDGCCFGAIPKMHDADSLESAKALALLKVLATIKRYKAKFTPSELPEVLTTRVREALA